MTGTVHAAICPQCRTSFVFTISDDPVEWTIITCPGCDEYMRLVDRAPSGVYVSLTEPLGRTCEC